MPRPCFRGLLFFYGVVVQVYAGYALNLLAEHKTRAWTSNKFVDISPAPRLVGTPDGQQVPRRPCVHVLKVGGSFLRINPTNKAKANKDHLPFIRSS